MASLPPTKHEQCGSPSGYMAHHRAGEKPCAACRRARSREGRAKKRAASGSATVTPGEVAEVPKGLGRRGETLWVDAHHQRDFSNSARVLLVEACRCADVLDRLDGAMRSKRGLWFSLDEESQELVDDVPQFSVVLDSVLGEQRRQRESLRALLKQLDLLDIQPVESSSGEKSMVDQLRERREARLKGEKEA